MAGAGQAYDKKHVGAGVQKTHDNISQSVSKGKKNFCLQVQEKSVGRVPDTKRVGRGLSICRHGRSIVARADFYQRVDNLQREKKIGRLQPFFFCFCIKRFFHLFPTAAVREHLPLFLECNTFERKRSTFAFPFS